MNITKRTTGNLRACLDAVVVVHDALRMTGQIGAADKLKFVESLIHVVAGDVTQLQREVIRLKNRRPR